MFDILGVIIQGFLYLWMFIIASVPNAFMGSLTICVAATVITYFIKRRSEQ